MTTFNTREEAFAHAQGLARTSGRESYSVSRRLHRGVVSYHVFHAAIIYRPCQFERMGHEFLGIASPRGASCDYRVEVLLVGLAH